MDFRFALTISLVIVSAGAPGISAQEGQTPSTQEVVKLVDLSSAAERVHSSTKAEAEKARSPQVKSLPDANASSGISWQSPARLRHWPTKTRGVLKIDEQGLEFRSGDAAVVKLSFLEVHTFFIAPHRLDIETYLNRKHRVPGEQRYGFDLDQAVPPEVAAGLAREVKRPSQNAVPDPASPSLEKISVHHHTRTGGTNGTLLVRDSGIDFVSSAPSDSRSWRWADLQTLSEPDPYHLYVFGYRDTYTFDLKEPIARALLNRMTNEIDSHNASEQKQQPENHTPTGDSERHGREVGDE